MEAVSASAVARAIAEFGILGLGWVLFIFMMFREIRERKRYSELVIHIIQYFTKVRMVEYDDSPDIPEALFKSGIDGAMRQRRARRPTRQDDDEETSSR